MIPQVIEVSSPLGLRPSGLEDAPDALRREGLHQRLGSPDAVRIDVPPYDDECRGYHARRRPLSRLARRRLQHCARTASRTAPPGPMKRGCRK